MSENAYIREDLKKTEPHRHTFPEGFSEMAEAYLAKVEAEMGLPTVDPYRQNADRLAEALAAL